MIGHAFLVAVLCTGTLVYLGSHLPASAGEDPAFAQPPDPADAVTPGCHRLVLDIGSGGLLYIPWGYNAEETWPFIVILYGAAGSGESMVRLFPLADEFGVIILAPDSWG